ncbi:cob(I)yrinic acid a,c-diamide adenosyltransferase, partial [Lysinibacillus sp. D4A1_S13]|uniref:cob(I)yrinic acid a,c-diamide adenosyltransferase n=1 Tax=Lysinibacillus sp. D4A1_S13 TaxID=2941228 RepID=UPI0020C02F91
IDRYTVSEPPLEKFIIPGGHKAAAQLHIARTVTRRAERLVAKLGKTEEINDTVMRYLNRLSDYFFAAARAINAEQGVQDI